MKTKKFILLLMSTIMVVGLSVYNKTNKNVIAKTTSKVMLTKQQISSNTSTTPLTSTIKTARAKSALASNLYSFQFSLNGVKYTLPCKYSELKKNGWVMEGIKGKKLKAWQYTFSSKLSNGKMHIYGSLVNTSQNTMSMAKCKVGKVSIDSYDVDSGAKLVFPKGITFGSTYKKVIAAYGKPTTLYNGSSIKILTYSSDTYSDVEIQVDKKTNKVIDLTMENMIDK